MDMTPIRANSIAFSVCRGGGYFSLGSKVEWKKDCDKKVVLFFSGEKETDRTSENWECGKKDVTEQERRGYENAP
jgi:hypothetical protein